MAKFLRDTRLIFVRSLMNTVRNPIWVLIGLFQPVLYLLLYAPLLDSVRIPGAGTSNSLNVFTPGLLVMLVLFGAAYAGFSVIADLRSGFIERLRVTPASRTALLLGLVLRDVLVLLMQCVVLIVTATLMGLRADPLGLVVLLSMLALLGLMAASFSYALGFIFKDEGGLAAMLNTVTQPLLLLSGVLLPMALAPKLLQTLSAFDPFSHAVDATRALVNGHLGDDSIMVGFGFVIVLTFLAVWWAASIFRHATA